MTELECRKEAPSGVRTACVVAGILAAFVLSFGAGVVLHRPRLAPAQNTATRAVAAHDVKVDAGPVARAPTAASDSFGVRLAEIVAALPSSTTREGDAVMEGAVCLDDGKGVADVRVTAVPVQEESDEEGSGNEARERKGIEEGEAPAPSTAAAAIDLAELRSFIARHSPSAGLCRTGVTGLDGGFRLTGMRPYAKYTLSFAHVDYAVSRKNAPDDDAAVPGEFVACLACPLRRVPVCVCRPDGTAPPACEIVADGEQYTERVAWSPRDASVRLAAVAYRLQAEVTDAAGTVLWGSEEQAVEIPPEGDCPQVVITLAPRLVVRGRVVFAQSCTPAAYVRLVEPGHRPCNEDMTAGSFLFENVSPGTYAVEAGWTSERIDASVTIAVVDRAVECELVMPPLAPEDCLIVRTCGPRGGALVDVIYEHEWVRREAGGDAADASAGAPDDDENFPDGLSGQPFRYLDGSFRIPLGRDFPRQARGRPLLCTLWARAGFYGEKSAEWMPGAPREVVFEFEEPAFLEVALPVPCGEPERGAVWVNVRHEDSEHTGQVQCGAGGSAGARAFIGPLMPGEYEVGAHGDVFVVRPIPVVLASGLNRAALPYPRLCELVVRVEGGTDASLVCIESTGTAEFEHYDSQSPGEDGRAVFEEVPVGDYRITLDAPSGPREMQIAVRGAMEVRFDGAFLNALRVSEGYEGGEGLEPGDLILGCDGRRFTDLAQLECLRWRSLTTFSLPLLVRRNGREMTIEVSLQHFLNEVRDESSFTPVRVEE